MIVEVSVAQDLIARLQRILLDTKAGPIWDANTGYALILSAPQMDRIDHNVSFAMASGVTVVMGAKRIDRAGNFYEAILWTDQAQN